ncbi:MAG TPA: ABC transporter ATP-binding protein [Deltaproteobacteria bacterium]|mgnify:CR=1 FL=1|jgi:branched-chain amino acid transport system ATP-binding protein|nr:ABC transporter ATP-binding protein [Deltaproteobacteria bacterium]|tara:strand:+ start:1716 stop:2429 length:714 start_codon:yes stop_codon:yes gene_type:complete
MLNVSNLNVNYGEVCAVKELSIRIIEGQIVSITGANGAGKSSTLNALAGIHPPSAGEIVFRGENITGFPAHRIVKRGLTQVPEGRHLFANLSVRENLLTGNHCTGRLMLERFIPEHLLETFPMLRDRLDSNASSLSGGQAQMLALARGLMTSPLLLLLDEPTLGLDPIMVKKVLKLISSLREQGLTILVVEQNVRQTLEISDYAYVLESGRMVMEGRGTELLKDSRLVESYLGVGKT